MSAIIACSMKEATLYKRIDNIVECTACGRRCKLKPGQIGVCGVRKNLDGRLYLLVYGKAYAVNLDPIEKKPLYHFHPGSWVLSFGTTRCNFLCAYCCNYHMYQRRRVEGEDIPPDVMVSLAIEYNSDGLAYTYNEPTIFMEYAHDVGVQAKKKGLFNVFVTNGYMTEEAVEYLAKFLDAAAVDIKGNANPEFMGKYAGVHDPQPIFDTLLMLKDKKIHVEITDLIVPEIGDRIEDAQKLMRWIYDNLGPDVPIHFIRFFPQYKLANLPPTPVRTLEKHYKLAKEIGMKYVYLGNVPGHAYDNTYCPGCGKLLIARYGFSILEWHLKDGRCMFCGAEINIKYSDDHAWLNSSRSWFIFCLS